MILTELLLVALMTHSPFGPIPFSVSQVGETHALVELLIEPPIAVLYNEKLEVVHVYGVNQDCGGEDENRKLHSL